MAKRIKMLRLLLYASVILLVPNVWVNLDVTFDLTSDITFELERVSDDILTAYLTMYGAHRAEKSFALLPKWLQNYFEWHKEQTQNPSHDTKYIVLKCHGGGRCGGVSDRLRPLPFYLLYASIVPRVLCIHWTKPFGLENYLVPPVDATGRVVDWRCPADAPSKYTEDASFIVHCTGGKAIDLDCLEQGIERMQKMKGKYVSLDLKEHSIERINAANFLFQSYTYAIKMPRITQWQFVDLMGDIFRVMFEPVPALAQSINKTMASLGLQENDYVSVHVRSRYPVRGIPTNLDKGGGLKLEGYLKQTLVSISTNAINCANLLANSSTIYFASDSNDVVRDTITRDVPVDKGSHVRPVGIYRDKEPLHSAGSHPESQISDFFPIFEDLLIMGGSKCVAHGIGSFGAFGAGLSGNRCRAVHRMYNGKPQVCPNDRTDRVCFNTTHFYKGRMLFETEIDGEGLISSVCDSMGPIKDSKTNHNKIVSQIMMNTSDIDAVHNIILKTESQSDNIIHAVSNSYGNNVDDMDEANNVNDTNNITVITPNATVAPGATITLEIRE